MLSKLKAKLLRILFYFRPIRFFLYNYKNFKRLRKFDSLKMSQNSIFIDIGANEGIISQYIDDKYNCKIEAYEPNPSCFKILEKKFNKRSNVSLFQLAVSNDEKNKKLFFHLNSKDKNDLNYSQAASLDQKKENISEDNYLDVKCLNIKDILNKYEKIDCIKIDIEGHEYKILPEIIRNRAKINRVFCELHGAPNSKKNKHLKLNYEKLINNLKNMNLYNTWFIEHF